MPRIAGHRQGVRTVREVTKSCNELGVKILTLYTFSSENWKRPASAVDYIMGLFRLYIRRELSNLGREGVRMRFIGNRSRLDNDIRKLILESEENTKDNTGLTFPVALNYGGRQEILEAVKSFAESVMNGTVRTDELTEALFESYLQSHKLPDPDLLIRTSGEKRISNFLLWQSAYTEFVFLPLLWPDFTREHLEKAIQEYQRRERRYGGSSN